MSEFDRDGSTILVVDDEEIIRRLARTALETAGFRVLEAASPITALGVSESHPEISLLLTDVVMPAMSGRNLAARIRAAHPEAQVIYMSGYAEQDLSLGAHAQEPFVFLAKPFRADTILDLVRDVLDLAD